MLTLHSSIVSLVFLLAAPQLLAANKENTKEASRPADSGCSAEFLEWQSKLDRRLFGEVEAGLAARRLLKAKDEEQARLACLLACHTAEERPSAALAILMPLLLGTEEARDWLARHGSADDKRQQEYKEQLQKAKKDHQPEPAPPMGLAIPLPVDRLLIRDVSPAQRHLLIGLARCLHFLKEDASAVALLNTARRSGTQESQALVDELSGELAQDAQQPADALKLYQQAEAILGNIEGECKRYQQAVPAWLPLLKTRLQLKSQQCRRLIDIASYGLGYVEYREAQQVRLQDKAYARAYMLYQQLPQKYPRSVYGEAGQAYALLALLNAFKSASAEIATTEKALRIGEQTVLTAKKSKLDPSRIKELQEAVEHARSDLAFFKKLPKREDARQQVLRETEALAAADPRQLYLGELYLALADNCMLEDMDKDLAEPLYLQALAYCDRVISAPEADASLQTPEGARKVSQPPESPRRIDDWGNADTTGTHYDQIVNRLTCPWLTHNQRFLICFKLFYINARRNKVDEANDYLGKAGVSNRYIFGDDEEGKGYRSVLNIFCYNYEHCRDEIFDLELADIISNKKVQEALCWAAVLSWTSSDHGHRALHLRIERGDYGKMDLETEAFVKYRVAHDFDFFDESPERVAAIYKEFEKCGKYYGCKIRPGVIYDQILGMQTLNHPELREKYYAMGEEIVNKYPNYPGSLITFAWTALIQESGLSGDFERCARYIDGYNKYQKIPERRYDKDETINDYKNSITETEEKIKKLEENRKNNGGGKQ